jgi:hypothetical protein
MRHDVMGIRVHIPGEPWVYFALMVYRACQNCLQLPYFYRLPAILTLFLVVVLTPYLSFNAFTVSKPSRIIIQTLPGFFFNTA